MSRRRKHNVDPYPGPDAVWLFLGRNKRPLAILLCGVLLVGVVWVFVKYWRGGGCAGTEAERAAVSELGDDPLLTARPPEATQDKSSTTYLSCPKRVVSRHSPPSPALPVAVRMVTEYRLTSPMTAVELHDHYAASVGRGEWRLTRAATNSLIYCRAIDAYRVVSAMTLGDDQLTITTQLWIDGSQCDAEVSIAH